MPLSDTYRAARVSLHQAGRSRALLLSKDHGQVMEVDASVARVLNLCQGCKTLEGHADAIARTGVAGGASAVLPTLNSLVVGGLLRSCADLLPADGVNAPRPEPSPISAIVVITADRPRVLRRGLDSFIRHLNEHGRRPRLLVVDGSREGGHQSQNRETAAELARTSNRAVEYVGSGEAADLRRRLAATGVSGSTLDFALSPGAIGANRNLALLWTVGEHLMMADDDIVCEPWARVGHSPGVAVSGHNEPHESECFPSREDALHAAPRTNMDLLAAHVALLGQPLSHLLCSGAESPDLSEACGHVISALTEGRSQIVRATFSGIAGDAGTYCPYTRLFSTGATHERMAGNREVYDLALRSREVLRITTRNVVTHDPRCMAGCMGLDNETVVPPFMPRGRNEDGVFGAMLGATDPMALFGHVPVGVVHDSGRPAMYEDRTMRSASETRVSELVMLIARASAQTTTSVDPGSRLARLADTLVEIGGLDAEEFIAHSTRLILDARAQQLGRIEAMVARVSEYPPFWRSGLEDYRRTFVRSLKRPDFFLPIEFHEADSIEQGFRELQVFIGQFGALVAAWPVLWNELRN